MKALPKKIGFKQFCNLAVYYSVLRYLPSNTFFLGGSFFKLLRYLCCRNIFQYCGRNVNIERMAYFGSGQSLQIGNNSGLGKKCVVPSDLVVGENVMMGPNCFILDANHSFERTDIPLIKQGHLERKLTIIKDDVWIGRQVLFTPGRIVEKGTIIGAGCVLTKNFESYAIVGGNPSRLIRYRNNNDRG